MITTDALPPTQPDRDETLGGRYLILGPLDPAGRVFRARDTALGRDVAVKLLGSSDSSGASEPLDVVRVLSRLSHPYVAEVYDIAESNGLCYVAMELVPGETLASAVRARGSLPPLEAVRIAVQVAEGLSAVHQLGIVHCDVKPSNIVLTPSGSAKLVDFGTARRQGRDDAERVVGSAPYIAPERLVRREVDCRADVYSLGATLYELLAGYPPHLGLDGEETLQKALLEDPVSPNLLNRDVPVDLSTVTMTALSRDPDQRYATAQEMASALRKVGLRLNASSGSVTTEFARPEHRTRLPVLARPRRGFLSRRTVSAGFAWAALLAFGLVSIVGGAPPGTATASASPRATATISSASALVSAVGSAASPTLDATATPAPTLVTPLLVDPTATVGLPTATASPTPGATRPPATATRQPATAPSQATPRVVPASVRPAQNDSAAPPTVKAKPASNQEPPKAAKADQPGKSAQPDKGKGHGKKG